ncbi:hypothetical protein Y032_0604g549 [Ancylostoma ceylanicum]|uniref:Uncharacterized protein n=1 Tax=Ancylostoma ceylanicum TaxID=53326 RepID=A0A016WNN3_9BILA|nr:hypothetical protein Y032_0604g549 [Ancylostoma ceylanicum]
MSSDKCRCVGACLGSTQIVFIGQRHVRWNFWPSVASRCIAHIRIYAYSASFVVFRHRRCLSAYVKIGPTTKCRV